ncbi:zf-HC2 domain-containing protein [uncultured Winogradskyella sp.]|uniref:zf-HC2 domain-containing protein n=1 Tax=uncultured Winogradskyella sp. TaxID=395353 RepID=UPI002625E1A8|nr:zf-HC2 domain-containing protein [uncultured Winogradskyella sp.]
MNCKEIKYLITDYQDNNLDQAIKTLVEEHLNSCLSCKQIHQEFIHLIDTINQVKEDLPDNDLELSFNDMLAKEKLALKTSKSIVLKQKNKVIKSILQAAAVILIMISCYLFGNHKSNTSQINEIATLKQEKTEMQTIATLSLMENESASKRLQAVNYAKNFSQPNNEILRVLIAKMNKDRHTNVRLAAANALAKFAENTNVRQALIKTLETEENPNMQIELIQILVDIEEKRAIPTMKKLLQNRETPSYIKDQINSELKQII